MGTRVNPNTPQGKFLKGRGIDLNNVNPKNMGIADAYVKKMTQKTGIAPAVAPVTSPIAPRIGAVTPPAINTGVTPTPAPRPAVAPAPAYDNSNGVAAKTLLGTIQDKLKTGFQYDPNTDAAYGSYKSQYDKKGADAYQNNAGSLASLTGGRMNSWSQGVAEAGKAEWDQNLLNMIPQLQANGEAKFNNGINTDMNMVNSLNSLDQQGYDRFTGEQNTIYNQGRDIKNDALTAAATALAQKNWQTTYDSNAARDKVGDSQWNTTNQQGLARDKVGDAQWNKTFDYNVGRDKVGDSQWQKQFNKSGGSGGGSGGGGGRGGSRGGRSKGNTNYLTSDDYRSSVWDIKNSPNGSSQKVRNMKEALTKQFGAKGYTALLKTATTAQAKYHNDRKKPGTKVYKEMNKKRPGGGNLKDY